MLSGQSFGLVFGWGKGQEGYGGGGVMGLNPRFFMIFFFAGPVRAPILWHRIAISDQKNYPR